MYQSYLVGGLHANILLVDSVTIKYLLLTAVTIRRQRRRLSEWFLSSLVHLSTRRCRYWFAVKSWGTSRRQRLFTSPILLISGVAMVDLEESSSADSLPVLTSGYCSTTSSRQSLIYVQGQWAAWLWLRFKAGFFVVKSSEHFDWFGFSHRTFSFTSQISTAEALALIVFSDSNVNVHELQIILSSNLILQFKFFQITLKNFKKAY